MFTKSIVNAQGFENNNIQIGRYQVSVADAANNDVGVLTIAIIDSAIAKIWSRCISYAYKDYEKIMKADNYYLWEFIPA